MPHGHCYYWDPYILWSHALSDGIIALAYMTIPFSLVKIVRGRKENDFAYMWILVFFAIFILGCGATHVMDVINIWEPWYLTDSAIRIITAIASIGTAIMLIRITPQLVMLPSANKWQEMNEELKTLNESLEEKVQERTNELEAMAERFRFMTNAIPQFVWTANPKGEVEFFNQNWYEYSGLSEQDSLQYGWAKKIHPDDLAEVHQKWSKSVEEGLPYEEKTRMADKQGKYRWHLVRGIPMKDAGGVVTQWFGTGTDIHDQVLKNQELERINGELDNFVYTASHDLRTPILNIDGLLQLLKTKVPAGDRIEVQGVYERMDQSVSKLKRTVHDLADITRIQSETPEDTALVNLSEMIEDFKVNHQLLIENSEAILETDLAVEEICCISSRHMRSLLDNILANAIKYRHSQRTPHVQIKAEVEGERYKISVSDNGVGIAPEHKDKVFDMFKRFNSHSSGSGVGLYIVKKIIEKYGGSIRVDSAPDKGTTFTIWLRKQL